MASALKSKQRVAFKKQSALGVTAGATGASEITSYTEFTLPFANNRVGSNVIGKNKMDQVSIAIWKTFRNYSIRLAANHKYTHYQRRSNNHCGGGNHR